MEILCSGRLASAGSQMKVFFANLLDRCLSGTSAGASLYLCVFDKTERLKMVFSGRLNRRFPRMCLLFF